MPKVKRMLMDIGQAVRRLKAGDSVRRAAWEDKDRTLEPDAAGDTDVDITHEDLLADDWETYDG
jgi:hypothetical protein